MAVSDFPDFDHLRESSRDPAPENAGIYRIGRPLPSVVFGKVTRWPPVTGSLPLGLIGCRREFATSVNNRVMNRRARARAIPTR